MAIQRLVQVLLHKKGRLVLSRKFSLHQDIGDAYQIADRYKTWDVDELIYLDITPHWSPAGSASAFPDFCETIRRIGRNCFVPLAAGGGIRSLDDMHRLIASGADRIVLNSEAVRNPTLITRAAHVFGAQAIIVGMDVRKTSDTYEIFISGGQEKANLTLPQWMQQAADLGAGEFFINSVDQDGTGAGYEEGLIEIASRSPLPVIFCGGAGSNRDFTRVLQTPIRAAAAANFFSFTEVSYYLAKKALRGSGLDVRPSALGMDYARARRERELGGSRLGAEKTILWQELDKGGLME